MKPSGGLLCSMWFIVTCLEMKVKLLDDGFMILSEVGKKPLVIFETNKNKIMLKVPTNEEMQQDSAILF